MTKEDIKNIVRKFKGFKRRRTKDVEESSPRRKDNSS